MSWHPMRIPSQGWAKAAQRFRELERGHPQFGTMRRVCEHVEQAPYRDLVHCALSMHTLLVSQHPELEWNCGVLRVELMGSTGQVSFTFCEQPFAEPASWRCDAKRHALLERYRDGRYRTLVSARVLNEGVDVPEARVAIIVAGRFGAREHIQRIGRVLRPAPGKVATVYELVTSGTVDDARARARGRRLAAGGAPGL